MTQVLIIEDNRLIADAMGTILDVEGFDPIVVTDSFRDLLDPHWIGYHNLDVALCDVHLGADYDGVSLGILQLLKDNYPKVSRIVLSGDEIPDPAVYTAAHRCLVKPTSFDDIMEALRRER